MSSSTVKQTITSNRSRTALSFSADPNKNGRARSENAIAGDFTLPDLFPLMGYTVAAEPDRIGYYTGILLRGLKAER